MVEKLVLESEAASHHLKRVAVYEKAELETILIKSTSMKMHTQQEHEICIPLKAQSKWSRTPPCLKLFSSWSLDYSDTC